MSLSATDIRKALTKTNHLIGEIGRVRRRRTVIETRMNDKIQAIKDQSEPRIKALNEREAVLVEQLLELVLPRYMFLRRGKTKEIVTANGIIKMRRNAVAVEVIGKEADVIKQIGHHRLKRMFVRRGEEHVDKKAVAQNPHLARKIQGLRLVNKTTVTIQPSKVDVKPIKQDVDSIKIVLPEED